MKVALITGAARRTGAEIARHLHAVGMNIVLHYHSSAKEADALLKELNAIRPASVVALRQNLSDICALPQFIDQAVSAFGCLHALINNASCFQKTILGGISVQDFDALMDTNLKAPFFLSQAAAPSLAKNRGCIINIADIHAKKAMRDYSIYTMSKAGLVMMTKAFAKELAPEVRVNAIAPGAIAWPEGANDLSDEHKQKIIHDTLLKRHGHPADIAKAVLFLINDAHYMTGQVLTIDGGRGC